MERKKKKETSVTESNHPSKHNSTRRAQRRITRISPPTFSYAPSDRSITPTTSISPALSCPRTKAHLSKEAPHPHNHTYPRYFQKGRTETQSSQPLIAFIAMRKAKTKKATSCRKASAFAKRKKGTQARTANGQTISSKR